MDQEIDFNTNLIVEREDAIREIEVTMYESHLRCSLLASLATLPYRLYTSPGPAFALLHDMIVLRCGSCSHVAGIDVVPQARSQRDLQ